MGPLLCNFEASQKKHQNLAVIHIAVIHIAVTYRPTDLPTYLPTYLPTKPVPNKYVLQNWSQNCVTFLFKISFKKLAISRQAFLVVFEFSKYLYKNVQRDEGI